MTAIKLMEAAHDRGFQRRVQFAMFEVAKDTINGAVPNEINYINGIINGEASVFQMAIGVLLNAAIQAAGDDVADAQIKTAVGQVFGFYASAWTARTV